MNIAVTLLTYSFKSKKKLILSAINLLLPTFICFQTLYMYELNFEIRMILPAFLQFAFFLKLLL